ncbi:MAG: DinB family protein [Taibaiella sp.]|nr:DinB family protein [Taibaiella sp.]
MTGANLKEQLDGLTWEQATKQVHSLNTIALLTFHINYYEAGLIQALQTGALTISDKYSYDMPTVTCAADWTQLREKALSDGETFAKQIEQLTDAEIAGPFLDGKYGSTYRNLTGMIEHMHYHLGQIAIIRKMVVG